MKTSALADLKQLKKALAESAKRAAAQALREREQRAREQHEADLFAITVGPVAPLGRKGRDPHLPRARPSAVPLQRRQDEAAVLREAISDDFDVESLLETDDSLSFRQRDVGPEVVRKLRRGVWAIQAQLDLHGFRRDEAREQLAAFLRTSVGCGLRCVRVIHGKGNGSPGREPILKAKVHSWLVQRNEVMAFAQARAADGGHGAVLVLLRPT